MRNYMKYFFGFMIALLTTAGLALLNTYILKFTIPDFLGGYYVGLDFYKKVYNSEK